MIIRQDRDGLWLFAHGRRYKLFGVEGEKEMSKPTRCFLCLGKFKDDSEIVPCPKCDRMFHTSCARRIGSCPVCGTCIIDDDDIRREEMPRPYKRADFDDDEYVENMTMGP